MHGGTRAHKTAGHLSLEKTLMLKESQKSEVRIFRSKFDVGGVIKGLVHDQYRKHMTLQRVTCNSFPWNKAADFMPKYGQK